MTNQGIVGTDCTECATPSAENCKKCMDTEAEPSVDLEFDLEDGIVSVDDVIDACNARFVRISREYAIALIAEHPGQTAKQIGDHVGYIADWGDPLDDPFADDGHEEMYLDDPEVYQAI